MADKKTRKTRSDCTVGTFEKKHGLPPGTFRNSNGRDTRSDKRIGTIRKEHSENKRDRCNKIYFMGDGKLCLEKRKIVSIKLWSVQKKN